MIPLREKEKEFKKQMIAEAAYELLSTRPYESVTVDDIAKLVGCGKGTLYLYFENKDHILAYLLSAGLGKLCADIENQCLGVNNIFTAVNNLLALQYNFFLEQNQIISSWLRRKTDKDNHSDWINEVHQMMETKLHMVAQVLEKGIKEKILISVNSYELARVMDNISREAALAVTEGRSWGDDPQRVLELLKMILNNGIFLEKSLANQASS